MKVCPFMSRDGKLTPCLATCALYTNGTCALAASKEEQELTKRLEDAQRLALLKMLSARCR